LVPGLLAIPIWCPDTLAAVVILSNTASQTKFPHETIAADPLKTLGKSPAELHKYGGVIPDVLQMIRCCMSEDEIRYGLPDPTKRIRAVGQHT
jgi:hypothetical protein